MEKEDGVYLIIRYGILLILGLFNLWIFYKIFTPLTVYPIYWILYAVDSGTRLLVGNNIFFVGHYAELVSACIAGAAYYLLIILNLATPMKFEKRLKSLGFLFGSFLFLNIIRIIIFVFLYISGNQFFALSHYAVWYFGSTVLVIVIWFLNIWLFGIHSIPIYSDVKSLFKDAFGGKRKK